MRHRAIIRSNVLLAVLLVALAAGGPVASGRQSDAVPQVMVELAALIDPASLDPVIVTFTDPPSAAGSFATDPAGDPINVFGFPPVGEGPDLLSLQWFTVGSDLLVPTVVELVQSGAAPEGVTLELPDGWVPPPAGTELVAFVLGFDRPIPLTVGSACLPGLNVRHPGATTPVARLNVNDRQRDTNGQYLFAGDEAAPYALEVRTETPDFATVVPESSVFGAIAGREAVFFVPLAELADVSALRASVDCFPGGTGDTESRVGDLTELVPFDPDSMGAAYLGPESAAPTPTTTVPSTTTTTDAARVATSVAPVDDSEASDIAPIAAPTGTPGGGSGVSGWVIVPIGLAIALFGLRLLRRAPF